MNNLNNAQKTFERAFKMHTDSNNLEGLCETRMHLAAVMQRLGDHETAARLLTEMGAIAMEHGLRKQLGEALHLLGELHLRRERPDLGTHHLSEAFSCFMGFGFKPSKSELVMDKELGGSKDVIHIYESHRKQVFEEEAEQSRLMMAVSAGQELMASYFNLLREAGTCSIAKMKTIEWKLSKAGWWVQRLHHDYLPCMCPIHNRTPLDVLRIQLETKAKSELAVDYSQGGSLLQRIDTVEDITKLRSSYHTSSRM
ncbi:hypothetical protein O3G_MSEX005665 [Manduca sexta]|uniref:Uncharacterized protein n=1 Tax=Manduca sexta TaxID=7130 RepID=A0A921Z0H8_MANSE|nr:hypothetical protein O3G_MSEX005665 [Manduca sexta]